MILQWLLILPISVVVAVSYGALIILFTDLATEDSKGEIMGITAAINAFAFGIVSFIGGALQSISVEIPLVASFLLMATSWLLFRTKKPQVTTLQTEHTL